MNRVGPIACGALLVLSGCNASTESRAREVFAVAPGSEVDTVSIAAAIARDLPIGTSRDSALRLLSRRGIGRVAHTSWHWFRDTMLVVQVGYDPNRPELVQASYGVGLAFSRDWRLAGVEVHRTLTGL